MNEDQKNVNFLSGLLAQAKEVLNTAQAFSKESSENLFAIFCMSLSSLSYYWIASYLGASAVAITFTSAIVAIMGLAGGFVLFRLITGRLSLEKKKREMQELVETAQTACEISDKLESLHQANRESLHADLKYIEESGELLDTIKQLPETSEKRQIVMEMAYSSFERFRDNGRLINKMGHHATTSAFPTSASAPKELTSSSE